MLQKLVDVQATPETKRAVQGPVGTAGLALPALGELRGEIHMESGFRLNQYNLHKAN